MFSEKKVKVFELMPFDSRADHHATAEVVLLPGERIVAARVDAAANWIGRLSFVIYEAI